MGNVEFFDSNGLRACCFDVGAEIQDEMEFVKGEWLPRVEEDY